VRLSAGWNCKCGGKQGADRTVGEAGAGVGPSQATLPSWVTPTPARSLERFPSATEPVTLRVVRPGNGQIVSYRAAPFVDISAINRSEGADRPRAVLMRVPLRSRWAIGFAVVGVVVLVACGVASSGALSGGPQSQPSRSTGNKLVSIQRRRGESLRLPDHRRAASAAGVSGPADEGCRRRRRPRSCEWRTISGHRGSRLPRSDAARSGAGRPARGVDLQHAYR